MRAPASILSAPQSSASGACHMPCAVQLLTALYPDRKVKLTEEQLQLQQQQAAERAAELAAEKKRQKSEFKALSDPESMCEWLAETLKRKEVTEGRPASGAGR